MVNTTDLIGGAERCSFDLHRGLRALGHKTDLVVGRRLSDDPDVHQCQYAALESKAWTVLRNDIGLTESILLTPFRAIRRKFFREADVVNIHNMHGCYWNFWTVPVLARTKPVVLTLHDEWLFTGDCAYTYDCDRWQKSCGSCPQMSQEVRPVLGGRDLTRLNLSLKRAALRLASPERVHIVSPSHWLAERAAKTTLRRFPITVIPNGIDLETFRPRDRHRAKSSFNVPHDRFCFLFFAANLSDPRKGVERLVETLEQFGMPNSSVLLLAGNGSDELASRFAGLPVISAGYIGDSDRIAECLSAADCMLLLSEADNLPYTALEAAACGCPTIALAVGGIPEEIVNKETGLLLPRSSKPEDLAMAMRQFVEMSGEKREQMSRRGRDRVERKFSGSRFIRGYENLFQRLADEHRVQTAKGRSAVGDSAKFEEQVVNYALQPENKDRFARLLSRILPSYTKWVWGQDDIYRRYFPLWQQAGFNLTPNHYYSPIPDISSVRLKVEQNQLVAGVE